MPKKPAPPAEPAPQPAAPQRRLPQFNMLGMIIVTLVCSVSFAGIYYLVKAEENDIGSHLTGILFLIAGPMLLMVIVSVLVALFSRAEK